jgi:hypothetical protein
MIRYGNYAHNVHVNMPLAQFGVMVAYETSYDTVSEHRRIHRPMISLPRDGGGSFMLLDSYGYSRLPSSLLSRPTTAPPSTEIESRTICSDF